MEYSLLVCLIYLIVKECDTQGSDGDPHDFCSVIGEGCKGMDFMVTMERHALVNHTFFTTGKVAGDGHCESMCFMDDRCISYNFGRSATGEPNTCELNKADHKQFPKDLIPRSNTLYRMAKNTCDCSRYEICRMDFVLKTHSCNCRSGYTLERCDSRFEVVNCKNFKDLRTEFVIDASDPNQKGICRGIMMTENDTPSQPYRITVEMYSFNTDPNSQAMHPGVGFNVQDVNNFDFVYFRLHTTDDCSSSSITQPGRIQRNTVQTSSATCTHYVPSRNKWFKVVLEVYSGSVKIWIDGNFATTYNGMSTQLIGRGAIMVYNGYKNGAKFRNYDIGNV